MTASFLIILGVFLIAAAAAALFFWRKMSVDQRQSSDIKDLERRLTDLMMIQMKEIRDSQTGASRAMNEQIRSFTQEATRIRDDLKQVQDKIKDVSSFQEIFKAPKLRGQWGEASLEHILAQHFPRELYEMEHLFLSGERVDAILKLPNGRILPIDAKFPVENFLKMIETADGQRDDFRARFISDLKGHIDKIAGKYIIPSESTVDFALMYIPAEAIYYEIVNNIGKEVDLTNYAWARKIILTSPNTIYLTLRTIEHWFKDTQISRQTQEILKRLDRVQQDAGKLMQDFRKLGAHLKNATASYDTSEKRLSLFSDKVERLREFKEIKKLKQ